MRVHSDGARSEECGAWRRVAASLHNARCAIAVCTGRVMPREARRRLPLSASVHFAVVVPPLYTAVGPLVWDPWPPIQ